MTPRKVPPKTPQGRSAGERVRGGSIRAVLFWILTLLSPLVLLLIVETSLRLFGVAAPPPLFQEVQVGTVSGYITNPYVSRRYFPPEMEAYMPRMGFQFFPRPKDPRTIRVFALGGSSTAGFPYHAHGSFTGILDTQLRHLLPARNIETVNCAMTALNSHAVRDILPEVLSHEPDLLLIYMGHNEYYGARGVGSITAGPLHWARPVMHFVLDLRLTALLRRGLRSGAVELAVSKRRNVMETMAAQRTIRSDSPLRTTAVREFERNLYHILACAGDAAVPVLLCTVSSNLRGQAPFGSAHPDGFTAEPEFDMHWETAQRSHEARDSLRALRALDAAIALDSTHAAARYLRALVHDQAGHTLDARKDYRAARDHDTVPFRAPQEINAAIRRVGREAGVPVIEVDSLLAAHSAHGIPGAECFLEHLHPNLRAAALIASALAHRLSALGWIAPPAEWCWERDLAAEQYIELAGVTELDREIADQRIHLLTQKWPYRQPGEEAAVYNSQREERISLSATAFVRKRVPLNEAHSALGDYYVEQGRIEDALREYRSSFTMFPLTPVPAVRLGQLLLATGRPRAARHYLDLALALDPASESTALLMVRALIADDTHAQALAVTERALRLHPQSIALRALGDSLRRRMAAPR